MGAEMPPATCAGDPVRVMLPAGERLLRVHRIDSTFEPEDFNQTICVPPDDGRFDNVDGTYGHIYVAGSIAGAIAEGILRGSHTPTAVRRFVPRIALAGRAFTTLELLSPASLVSLRGPDVGHVCQDGWLTKCDGTAYPLTRAWGAAIRRWAPTTAGMLWWARKNENEMVAVLYDDRLPMPALRRMGAPITIDSGPGLDLVIALLAAHNVTVL